MKIIFKKPLWFTVITTLCLIAATLFAATACDKWANLSKPCNVDNPLTDLPWLKDLTDNAQQNGWYSRIYQCTYKDGICFLVEPCEKCRDAGYSFLNCKGKVLCGGGGISGKDNCSKFNIDFENRKLIWEINK